MNSQSHPFYLSHLRKHESTDNETEQLLTLNSYLLANAAAAAAICFSVFMAAKIGFIPQNTNPFLST